VKLIHVDPTDKESIERVDQLIEYYANSEERKQTLRKDLIKKIPVQKEPESYGGYAASYPMQAALLWKRSMTDIMREPLK
jgi:hypothetical protein